MADLVYLFGPNKPRISRRKKRRDYFILHNYLRPYGVVAMRGYEAVANLRCDIRNARGPEDAPVYTHLRKERISAYLDGIYNAAKQYECMIEHLVDLDRVVRVNIMCHLLLRNDLLQLLSGELSSEYLLQYTHNPLTIIRDAIVPDRMIMGLEVDM